MELTTLLRERIPTLYRALFKLRHSRRGLAVVGAYRRGKFALAERVNGGVCAFDIVGAMGFGATLTHILVLLDYCDRRGLTPAIRASNRLYRRDGSRSRDWFGDFFVQTRARIRQRPLLLYAKVQSNDDYPRMFADDIDVERAHYIFNKYVGLASEAACVADVFAQTNFRGRALGVHYRGTNKVSEAPRVAWEVVVAAVRQAIVDDPAITTIFVASDEPEFVRYLGQQQLRVALCSYECKAVGANGAAAYLHAADGATKGLEALVTILLLARCDIVVRTPSHLSAWAKILNPDQKVVMLARPYDAVMSFPERPIWEGRMRAAAE